MSRTRVANIWPQPLALLKREEGLTLASKYTTSLHSANTDVIEPPLASPLYDLCEL